VCDDDHTNAAQKPETFSCSPAGGECITGSSDKRVRVWDLGQRQCVYTCKDHADQVWGVCYNSSGSKFASCSDDGSIVVGSKVTG